jgi:hypothetical protein
MLSLYRGRLAGFLVAALVTLIAAHGQISAQDKKDDLREKSVGFGTSDGLSLSGYWFQGNGIDKQRPDAVMMFPAPGGKINDNWVSLARALSEKNFSVLLFDWRGAGLNGPDGIGQGARIYEDKEKFWKERYNDQFLKARRATLEKQGLDIKYLLTAGNDRGPYRPFLLNDLMGARFFLDKQNDAGKCNTNRVWIVSEKDGAHVGLAFIATEFSRNSLYDPKKNVGDTNTQFKAAGKDYAGIMAMSPSLSPTPMNSVANSIYSAGLPSIAPTQNQKDGFIHLEDRLAMVLMFSKQEGATTARSWASRAGVSGTDDEMKKKFKYLKEFDIKAAKPINGVDMIDPNDSFKVRDYVVKAMVEISKDKQNFGKDPTDREAAKMTILPRFDVERWFLRR